MQVLPVTPTIGAEIGGIDLSQSLDPETQDRIYAALMQHLVLFFRDQDLSPQAQFDFATTFGTSVEPHPIYPHVRGHDRVVLLENDGARPPDTDDWHSDLTFQPQPPFLSVLHAIEVPDTGGDTLWANMYAAYDTLPDDMQARPASRRWSQNQTEPVATGPDYERTARGAASAQHRSDPGFPDPAIATNRCR